MTFFFCIIIIVEHERFNWTGSMRFNFPRVSRHAKQTETPIVPSHPTVETSEHKVYHGHRYATQCKRRYALWFISVDQTFRRPNLTASRMDTVDDGWRARDSVFRRQFVHRAERGERVPHDSVRRRRRRHNGDGRHAAHKRRDQDRIHRGTHVRREWSKRGTDAARPWVLDGKKSFRCVRGVTVMSLHVVP